MTSRTIAGMSAQASVVTSPATCTWPVVTMVSTATRERGSLASRASRIESLIASQILSGWPSVTDSEVNNLDVTDTNLPNFVLKLPDLTGPQVLILFQLTIEQDAHRVPNLGRQLRLGAQRDQPFGAVGGQ